MWNKRLDDLVEADLQSLIAEKPQESITLEFKRQLDLGVEQQKAEIAKDVSALANTAGGRIVIGIEEKEINGIRVAHDICPFSDGGLQSRLEDVLLATIHPRPRFRTKLVSVNGGFGMVVEVYPSLGQDLHMVTGFRVQRFYRRRELRTDVMTEPEVREAYVRVAASHQSLNAAMEAVVADERRKVAHLGESVIVVPWYGHRDLVNPLRLGRDFGRRLREQALGGLQWQEDWGTVISALRVHNDGYRTVFPTESGLSDCTSYALTSRAGVVHLSQRLSTNSSSEPDWHSPSRSLETVLATLLIAKEILEASSHWGPVRVLHLFRAPRPFHFRWTDNWRYHVQHTGGQPVEAGEYAHTVTEARLQEAPDVLGRILEDIANKLAQTHGFDRSPWFKSDGALGRLDNSWGSSVE